MNRRNSIKTIAASIVGLLFAPNARTLASFVEPQLDPPTISRDVWENGKHVVLRYDFHYLYCGKREYAGIAFDEGAFTEDQAREMVLCRIKERFHGPADDLLEHYAGHGILNMRPQP